MGNAPGDPLGAFRFRRCDGSSSLFLGQLLRLSAADLDLARLGGLGNLMHEVDMPRKIQIGSGEPQQLTQKQAA